MNHERFRLVTLLFGLAYIASAGFAISLALDPKTYFFYTEAERAAWHFDPRPVAVVCLVMLAELLLVRAALVGRWNRPLWVRALVAAAALTPWALLCSVYFLHAPGYLLFHIIWLWGLVAVLAVSIVASLIIAGAHRLWRGQNGAGPGVQASDPAA
jgi:hypothetical protein